MKLLTKPRKWRGRLLGALGGGALLIACCILVPLVIGVAGLLAAGIEVAIVLAAGTAAALVLRHRRQRGTEGCVSNQGQGREQRCQSDPL